MCLKKVAIINIKLEDKATENLRQIATKQIPFVVAKTLTQIAGQSQQEVRKNIREKFFIRKKSGGFESSIRIKPATKTKLTAEVYTMAAFAALQQTGGVKKAKDGRLAIPSYQAISQVKKRSDSNSPSSYLAGDAFKIKTKSGAEAIAQRKRGGLKILYFLRKEADIEKRFDMIEITEKTVRNEFGMIFNKKFLFNKKMYNFNYIINKLTNFYDYMVLIFHEMGHNQAGVEAGASVDVFLEEGLVSKALLRQAGKLPPMENPYERALRNREEWIEGRKKALGDNPSSLKSVLDSDIESTWVKGEEVFYKPGHPAHREESVFFGYSDHPSSNRDWVAIEVPETATLHDVSCRDRQVPDEWLRTAVTIRQFREMQARGETPRGWESRYNEHLIRDRVPAERIVAYAKVEKELPVEKPISAEELEQVQNFVSNKLGFATQFDDPKDNVLVHEDAGKYQIRVSFNKAKVTGREGEISDFFDQFQSFQELISEAKIFSTPKHLPKNHPKHPEYKDGSQEQGI